MLYFSEYTVVNTETEISQAQTFDQLQTTSNGASKHCFKVKHCVIYNEIVPRNSNKDTHLHANLLLKGISFF